MRSQMIIVTGEALMDLVIDGDGRPQPRPGGGPFNTARTIGRLGLEPAFLGRLSRDDFGHQLRARLEQDGVMLAVPQPADTPTTLAIVDVDAAGAPRYRFYLAGTSSAALEYPLLTAALPVGMTALHAGTLALVMEPIATSIERLITTGLPPGTLVMIDPNCRPGAIADRSAYLGRLARILRRADVVKVSMEDLAYLYPGATARTAAATLLGQEPRLVLITDGPRPAWAFLPGQEMSIDVPVVQVADTIGPVTKGKTCLAPFHASRSTRGRCRTGAAGCRCLAMTVIWSRPGSSTSAWADSTGPTRRCTTTG